MSGFHREISLSDNGKNTPIPGKPGMGVSYERIRIIPLDFPTMKPVEEKPCCRISRHNARENTFGKVISKVFSRFVSPTVTVRSDPRVDSGESAAI